MGNLRLTSTLSLIGLCLLSMKVQAQEEEQTTPDTQSTCNRGFLLAVSNGTDGILLRYSTGENETQIPMLQEAMHSSLPSTSFSRIRLLTFRLAKEEKVVYIIPQRGGVLLVSFSFQEGSYVYLGNAFISSSVDCVFSGFIDTSEFVLDSVLGFCIGENNSVVHFHPLTVRVDFVNISNSQIALRRGYKNGRLYGSIFNAVAINNRCLPDHQGHVIFIDAGEIIDFNIESGQYSFAPLVDACIDVTRLELVSPNMLVAYCNESTILINFCKIKFVTNSDVPSRYSRVFSEIERGKLYFCTESQYVSVKNGTIRLCSVDSGRNSTCHTSIDFLSAEIIHGECSLHGGVYYFLATLDDGQTWFCNVGERLCEFLGESVHAVDVPSQLVEGRYAVVNNDSYTILYDLCAADPITQLNHNFDVSYFSLSSSAVCQCASQTTPSPTTISTVIPTTVLPDTSDQPPIVTESVNTSDITTLVSRLPPDVGPPRNRVKQHATVGGSVGGAIVFFIVAAFILVVIFKFLVLKRKKSEPVVLTPTVCTEESGRLISMKKIDELSVSTKSSSTELANTPSASQSPNTSVTSHTLSTSVASHTPSASVASHTSSTSVASHTPSTSDASRAPSTSVASHTPSTSVTSRAPSTPVVSQTLSISVALQPPRTAVASQPLITSIASHTPNTSVSSNTHSASATSQPLGTSGDLQSVKLSIQVTEKHNYNPGSISMNAPKPIPTCTPMLVQNTPSPEHQQLVPAQQHDINRVNSSVFVSGRNMPIVASTEQTGSCNSGQTPNNDTSQYCQR